MKLFDIIRRQFLPPVMDTSINSLRNREYKIIPNKGGFSFFAEEAGDKFFSVIGGSILTDLEPENHRVDVCASEEDASEKAWDHFDMYCRRFDMKGVI